MSGVFFPKHLARTHTFLALPPARMSMLVSQQLRRSLYTTVKQTEVYKKVMDDIKSGAGKLTILQFSADWCHPCRQVSPQIERLSTVHPTSEFYHIDIDRVDGAQEAHEIESLPTFKFFKDGKLVDTIVGTQAAAVEKAVKKHLGVIADTGAASSQ